MGCGDGRPGSSLELLSGAALVRGEQGSRLGERTEAPRVALHGEDPSALCSVGLRQPFRRQSLQAGAQLPRPPFMEGRLSSSSEVSQFLHTLYYINKGNSLPSRDLACL